MKRVAIVGADFIPSSLPPATRMRLFARHLPDFGWQPLIITTEPRYYESPVDPENEKLLPKSLEIIRTPALPAAMTRKIGIGDIGIRSIWHHWKVLNRLCREQKLDLVFISVPPYVPMILGRLVHQRFGIPYVIDYMDPWVTEHYWKLPKAQRPPKWELAYFLSRILEPIAIKHASHIVGVSKGTTQSVINRYRWLNDDDATEIPYGGEASDFDYLRMSPRGNKIFNPSDGFLHISYVGACIPAMYATVEAILEAVRSGLNSSPRLFSRLRLHFIGTTYAPNADGLYQVLPLAEKFGLQQYVDEHPQRVPYLDSLQIMLDSHALLLIGSDASHYTASKVFPCILARRPLLAVFHEASSVVTLLRETDAGRLVTFTGKNSPREKSTEISKYLEEILSLPSNSSPSTKWEAFEPYSARAMTGRLAQSFEKALLKGDISIRGKGGCPI